MLSLGSSPHFQKISCERVYLYFLSLISLFFLFLCVSTRRTCHCLAKTAGECYLCLSLPFSLSIPLSAPPIYSLGKTWFSPWRKAIIESYCTSCCLSKSFLLSVRDWRAFLNHKRALHVLSESHEKASIVLMVWSVNSLCEGERGGGLLKWCWSVSKSYQPVWSAWCCPWCWKTFRLLPLFVLSF